MENVGLPIREFIYFDREKVEDFVSALLGGLPEEIKEADSDKSPQISGKVDLRVVGLERKGGTRESSWEEIRKATPASLFVRLHSLLEQKNAIRTVDSSDAQRWDALQEAEFVEFRARTELSALERLFEVINNIAPFIETFSPEQIQDRNSQNILKLMKMYEKESYNVRIVPLDAQTKKFIFVASLQKEKTRASKEELSDEYIIFGRIRRKLAKNETFELFSLLPGGIKLPRNQMRDLLTSFKDMPTFLGPPPKMQDLRISYPAIILTPIAIYR